MFVRDIVWETEEGELMKRAILDYFEEKMKLNIGIIDGWASYLNWMESLKSDGSPARVFFQTDIVVCDYNKVYTCSRINIWFLFDILFTNLIHGKQTDEMYDEAIVEDYRTEEFCENVKMFLDVFKTNRNLR